MRKLFFLFFLSIPLPAQNYVVQKTTNLSGAAEGITVQSTGTLPRRRLLKFQKAYVDCAVACTITLARTGTPATTTTLAINNTNKGETVASANAFSSSNVGAGTTLGVYSLSAGGSLVLDLSSLNFRLDNTSGDNLTLSTNTISGIVDFIITFNETDI